MKKESLPNIDFSNFEIILNLEKDSQFYKGGFPGAAVRGAIMNKAKKLLCANPRNFDCKSCMLAEKCAYAKLFETVRPRNSKIMRKYKQIPHPFVLTPIIKEDEMNVKINLFGEYIGYFPYFFLFFKALEEEKKFSVISVRNFEKEILRENTIQSEFITQNFSTMKINDESANITIKFITPLRIKSNGKYVNQSNLKFEHIIRNLIRRIYLISYFYGKEWAPDFKEIIEESKKVEIIKSSLGWLELERYSTRQKTYIGMGGIVGEITLSDNAKEFYPILKIGEYLQIGKNTSFGHGYYKIE